MGGQCSDAGVSSRAATPWSKEDPVPSRDPRLPRNHNGFPHLACGDRIGSNIPAVAPPRARAVPFRIRKPHLSFALGRLPIQRPFKLSRGRRSFEVAGQNFTIRCVAAVEFFVGVPIRTKRGAVQ